MLVVQMNQVTGYLDGSNIYGSSLSKQRELREGRGGRLAIQNVRGRQLLPENRGECTDDTEQLACFKAGMSTSTLVCVNEWLSYTLVDMAANVIRLYVLCEVQAEAEETAEHQACNTA